MKSRGKPELSEIRPAGIAWRTEFRRRLLRWYRQHARDLPWRRTKDPYAIWVSEIMLQQTQVETVRPYYQRFLLAFPDIRALASAAEVEVLRLWEGLGYYRRARQLHAAAKLICEQHGGRFPLQFEEVLKLPGIGRYSAGAILSFARNQRYPILEANTLRLFVRLLNYGEDPRRSAGQAVLWDFAESLLPKKQPGVINQALMELGSRVCTPKSPECHFCPVSKFCSAFQQGTAESLPAAKKKMNFQEITEAAVVVRSRGQVLMRQCGENERWAGLWDFPRFPVAATSPVDLALTIPAEVERQTGQIVKPGQRFATLKHGVTKYRITLLCFHGELVEKRRRRKRGMPQQWVSLSGLDGLPLSTSGRKICRILQQDFA